MNVARIAGLFKRLMVEELGYPRFGAQGLNAPALARIAAHENWPAIEFGPRPALDLGVEIGHLGEENRRFGSVSTHEAGSRSRGARLSSST